MEHCQCDLCAWLLHRRPPASPGAAKLLQLRHAWLAPGQLLQQAEDFLQAPGKLPSANLQMQLLEHAESLLVHCA